MEFTVFSLHDIYNLFVLSEPEADITETKQLLDRLVVLKFNGASGKNMGFSGPK